MRNDPATETAGRSLRPALGAALALLALTGALWLLHIFGRTLPTASVAAAWAVLAVTIGMALFRRARLRRAAFLAAYFRPGSSLAGMLRGGWPMAVRSVLLASVVALFLTVALIRLDDAGAWAVLVGGVTVLALAHARLSAVLAAHASAGYLPELAWRTAAAGVGAIMVAALVALAFFRAYPELGAVSLEQAVWHFVDAERARSAPVETLLQMAAAKDALRLWLAQQLMPQPGTSLAEALAWLVVLAEEAVFVWSYLHLCSAVLLGIGSNDRSDRHFA